MTDCEWLLNERCMMQMINGKLVVTHSHPTSEVRWLAVYSTEL